MKDYADWLPDLILCDEGDREAYIERVYAQFCDDYLLNPLLIGSNRIALEKNPLKDGRHRAFWHLTTEGRDEEHRTLCIAKCERIRWPKALLLNIVERNLPTWRNMRGTRENLLIALPDFSYVVVLAVRKGYYYLWTAYCVEYERQIAQLREEWQRYADAKKA